MLLELQFYFLHFFRDGRVAHWLPSLTQKRVMSYPYIEFENTNLWNVLKEALEELKNNQDIEITTNEKYVLGFLCKALYENDILPKEK